MAINMGRSRSPRQLHTVARQAVTHCAQDAPPAFQLFIPDQHVIPGTSCSC